VKEFSKILFILASLFFVSNVRSQIATSTTAKESSVPGIFETKFLRDSILLDEKGFAFNSLTVRNISSSKLEIIITADLKEKIQLVNPLAQNLTLEAGETKVIPLRFNLVNSSIISGSFPVRFNFSLPASSRTIFNEFTARIQKNTKWRSVIDKANIIFKGAETSLPFNVTIDNRGNSEENYDISFEAPDGIVVKGQKKSITLAANQSKTFEFFIENAGSSGRPISVHNGTVEVQVKNGAENRKYKIELIKLGSVYTEYISRMKKVPLTVELNANNLGNANPYYFARVYGTLDFNERERLKVYYQSDNYFKTGKAESFIGFAQYANKNITLHAGSIQEFNNFQVDGLGLRFQVRSSRSITDAYYVSGRNQNTSVAYLGNTLYFGKKWTNISRAMYYDDKLNLLKSGIAENELAYSINKNTHLVVMGGISLEKPDRKITPEEQRGMFYGYEFNHLGEKLSYSSLIKKYSDGYAGFNKGFNFQQHKIKYQGGKAFVQASFDLNVRSQNSFSEFGLNENFNIDSKIASLNFGLLTKKGTFTLGPALIYTKQDSASSFTQKSTVLNLNIFYSLGETGIISLISQTGYASLPKDVFAKQIFVSSNFGSVSTKNFGLQYRFDHGPVYYYEVSQYIKNTSLNTTRYQLSPYLDFAFPKINLTTRFQYTMNREFISEAKDDYVFYHFLLRHPKTKWEAMVSGQYNLVEKQRSFLNLTYRRQISVPVVKNNKVRSGNFVFFKDINNNGTYDTGDQLLPDMQLFANKSMLLTDKQGAVQIANTDDDVLNVDFTSSNNTQGWIPLNGTKQAFTLTTKTKTQYIPFKKGKLLKGVINLVKDVNSTLYFSVQNIRVTAESSEGVKYTAITNEKGEFYFNVVNGNYIVSLPQIFDDVFKPVEFVKTADLTLNDTYTIVFEVRQKKRNVNIKKN
jgi:hypothetical protein